MSTFGLVSGLCIVVPPAWAQDEGTGEAVLVQAEEVPFRQLMGVEVTGTAILNPRSKEAAPIHVIERREIERSSVRHVVDLLQALPMMVNGGELGSTILRSGPESLAIHGYEAGTLVLLNGRRLGTYALQATSSNPDMMIPELSALPLNAIERIEILSDGASARYGSDAIAGVVNLITRDHLRGVELSVRAGLASAGGDGSVGLAWGNGDLMRDGYGLRIFGQVSQRNRLTAGDRQQLYNGVPTLGLTATGDPVYPLPGAVYSAYGTRPQPKGSQAMAATCTEPYSFVPAYGQCMQFLGAYQDIYPQVQERQLLISAERRLPSGMVWFGDWLMVSRQQSFFRPLTSGVVRASDTKTDFLFFPSSISPAIRDIDTEGQRATVGLRGQYRDYDFKLTLNRAIHQGEVSEHGGALPGWNQALSLTQVQLEKLVENWDTEAKTALAALRKGDVLLRTGGTKLWQAEALLSGPWTTSVGIEHRWALGGSWVHESMSASPVATAPNEVPIAQSRRLAAVFSEWEALWSERWRTGVALRHDDYSDVGASTTGRVQAQWRWASDSFLRMSYGTGFRAPALRQLNPVRQLTLTKLYPNNDIGQCPAEEAPQSMGATCSDVYTQGNPNLSPERSQHLSLGMRWEPSLQWSLGMDVWRLRSKNIFGTLGLVDIWKDPSLYRLYVVPPAAGVPEKITLLALNLGTLDRSGADYDVQYRTSGEAGRWRLAWQGTHYLHSQRTFVSGAQPLNEVGVSLNRTEQFVPRHRFRFTLAHEQNRWAKRIWLDAMTGNDETVSAVTGLYPTVSSTAITRRVRSHWTVGVGVVYRPHPSVNWTLAIDNLLDRDPPARYGSPTSFFLPGVDARYGSYLGRTLRVGLTMGF